MIGRMRVFLAGLLLVALNSIAGSPIHYVENKNQWPSDFRFGAEFPQMKVMLKDASIFFVQHSFIPDDKKSHKKQRFEKNTESHVHAPGETSIATFELQFLNALKPTITASDVQVTKYNYFLGNDKEKWTSNAAAYSQIVYNQLYAGIDLKVYSQGDLMKYDWIVSPCADVRKIQFTYKGVEHMELRDENLVVESKIGEVTETKPYAYQVVNGQHRPVAAAFELDDETVSFVFPDGFDSNYELIIDPELIFSSYSGSVYDNWGTTATPGERGSLYSGGTVRQSPSTGHFPTTAGAYQTSFQGGPWDIGILKYDSSGANVLYATYLGGNGTETPQSLVVSSNNELLIIGTTGSSDFPGTSGGFKGGDAIDPLGGVEYDDGTDLFIAKLSADGSQLLNATYIGGSENDGINFISGNIESFSHVESPLGKNYGDQFRADIITDAAGNVYIATNTLSSDFPVLNTDLNANWHGGSHDAVVAKFTSGLSLEWSRLIGGSNTDAAYSIKLTSTGNVMVGGGTNSTNLAGMNGLITTAPGGIDGWIMTLSPDGTQIIDGTYVGTSSYDQVYFIDIATTGDVFAYGQTQGQYPRTAGVYGTPNSGQFLHRFSPDLKTTVFSTTFGTGNRTPNISPTAFLVSDCDKVFMAGWGGAINTPEFWDDLTGYVGANTRGLPIATDAWQPNTSGNDFYLITLSADGTQFLYSTFFGGTNSLTHVDGGTSRFDKRGIVYHAVCASCGFPDDFPAYNVPASRSRNGSNRCNNAAFKFDLLSLRAVIQTNNTKLTQPGFNRLCLPDSIVFQNVSLGGAVYDWDFGDGKTLTVANKDNIKHYYEKPGRYNVKLKATDITTCAGVDETFAIVDVYRPDMSGGPDQAICFGSSTKLEATGSASNVWKTITGFSSNELKPTVSPDSTTNYFLTMTDADGCVLKDTLSVRVVPGIDVKFDYGKTYDCDSRPYVTVHSDTQLKEGEETQFVFGDGNTSSEAESIHNYERDGQYTIALRATKEFCTYEASEDVKIYSVKVPNVITPLKEDGLNDSFRISYGNPPVLDNGVIVKLKIANRWGTSVFESKDYKGDWRGSDNEAGVYYYEVEMVDEFKCKGWVQLIK